MSTFTYQRSDNIRSNADPDARARLLPRKQAESIIQSLMTNSRGGGYTSVLVGSIWQQTIGWARNRVTIAGNRQKQLVLIDRQVPGYGFGTAATNQFDDTTLLNMLRTAEFRGTLSESRYNRGRQFVVDLPDLPVPDTPLWSEATAQATEESKARLATMLSEQATSKGLLSAGCVEMRMASFAESDNIYGPQYCEYTQAYSSVTVRNPQGTGSGWSGESGFDWGRIDAVKLAGRALEKCIASIDPVRVEPGRYTVVLEPQAVEGLLRILVDGFSRSTAEEGRGPYASEMDPESRLLMTKLGTKITDERVTIYHDPAEAGTAVLPRRSLAPIKWIERGILTTLEDGSDVGSRFSMSLPGRNENIANLQRRAFRMAGGDTPVEEMIRTTKRGLLVTRFWGIQQIDRKSVLATGVTRDGLWLIENGAITKAVKNMRFIESPLFVLNQLDQLGEPVQIFVPPISGGGNLLGTLEFIVGPMTAVVPPIKVHDFNFAALVDAV